MWCQVRIGSKVVSLLYILMCSLTFGCCLLMYFKQVKFDVFVFLKLYRHTGETGIAITFALPIDRVFGTQVRLSRSH